MNNENDLLARESQAHWLADAGLYRNYAPEHCYDKYRLNWLQIIILKTEIKLRRAFPLNHRPNK